MSAFWCVFWWVLLGFVLGWLCNWLLCRRLSGGDGQTGATQTAAVESPSAAGEGSGMNWQTQMVDISGRTAPSAGIAAAQSGDETESETESGSDSAGIGTAAESGVPTAADAQVQSESAARTEPEPEQQEPEEAGQKEAGQKEAGQKKAGQKELESAGASDSSASGSSEQVPAAPSLFASEKHSRGKTFAGIDSDPSASDQAEGDGLSDGHVQKAEAIAGQEQSAPVFAAVVSVGNGAAEDEEGEARAAVAEKKAEDQGQESGLTAEAVMSEQQGHIAAVALDLTAARTAGFSVKGEDDLTVVEGIGPKISRLFKDAGILTLAELGRTPTQRMQEILDAAGPRYRLADPTTWGQQAELAADNRWSELKAFQDTLDGGRLV